MKQINFGGGGVEEENGNNDEVNGFQQAQVVDGEVQYNNNNKWKIGYSY